MPVIYHLPIHIWLLCGLDVLASGWPDHGFVDNKQMAFFQSFASQQLLFLFTKHLDTMSIRWIVSPVKQIFG